MNLFEYTDYRAYLKDYYTQQKSRNPSYSYRVFANRAKLNSPNYLKLVIDGARRITDRNLPCFIRGLGLGMQEADYLKSLVLYQESKDVETKGTYFQELMRLRKKNLSVVQNIDEARYEFFKEWYHMAVRELILLDDFTDDPRWIASRLRNKITPKQAEESMQLLLNLNFIKRDDLGKYHLSEPLFSTTDEVISLQIRQLHKQFIELGMESIFNDAIDEREVNGLVLAVAKQRIPEIKKAIKEFRKELNRNFSSETNNQEVYYLMMNFFPLTNKKGRVPS